MRTIIVGALMTSATALLAAPGQRTPYPGQMTEGRVWVQNRGSSEAIPIDVREVNIDRPLKVQVVNGLTFEQYARDPVNVRIAANPNWEYKSVMIDSGADPVPALNKEGAAGWETTGIVAEGQGKMTLLLKRVR
jgi:hypothetical protein